MDHLLLFQYVLNNEPALLSQFLNHQPNLSIVNYQHKSNNNYSPLHYASARGFDSIVTILLNAGALVNAIDIDLETPLHKACFHGYLFVVELLVNHHADLNALSLHHWSPLHIAVARNHSLIVQYLISRPSTNINIVNQLGTTPRMLASTNGKTKMVNTLVNIGHAKTNMTNGAGENAYDLAVLRFHALTANALARLDPRLVRNTRLRCIAEHAPKHSWIVPHQQPFTLIESDPTGNSQSSQTYTSLAHVPLIPGWNWITSWQVLADWYLIPLNALPPPPKQVSRTPSQTSYSSSLSLVTNNTDLQQQSELDDDGPLALALGAVTPGSKVRVWGRVMRKSNTPHHHGVASTSSFTTHIDPIVPTSPDYIDQARSILDTVQYRDNLPTTSEFDRYQAAIHVLSLGVQSDSDPSRIQNAKFILSQHLEIIEQLSKLSPNPDLPPPQPWIPDNQVDQCTECGSKFSVIIRKHHCRLCGHIYCATCSSFRVNLQSYYSAPDTVPNPRMKGIGRYSSNKVRVCKRCHLVLIKSSRVGHRSIHESTSIHHSEPPEQLHSPTVSNESITGSLTECPRCFQALSGFSSSKDRESHLQSCLDQHPSMSSKPTTTVLSNISLVARQYTIGYWHDYTESTEPCTSPLRSMDHGQHAALVDSATECLICYERFDDGVRIIRMGCMCCFHSACAMAWFDKYKEIVCPMHISDEYTS